MCRVVFSLLIVLSVFMTSCSGADVASPSIDDIQDIRELDRESTGVRTLWGLWEISGDLANGKFEIIPSRQGAVHLNALAMLEPPAYGLLTIEGPIKVNGNIIEVDIGLRHPFASDPTFTGFDVKGIIITPANDGRYPGPFGVIANDDVTHLDNPDGYSLWWGPYLFPPNETSPNQGYIDGLLGNPDELVKFASNVNAYKYYCDDLGADDDVALINPAHRGVFGVGAKNVRHYQIKVMENTFLFNYAVDASWGLPNPIPPDDVYADFPPYANQPEAYRAEVTEVKNTLYHDGYFSGGDLVLDVKAFTWRDPTTTQCVFMEAPEVFTQVFSDEPVETGEGWARYRLEATSCTTEQTGPLFVLVGIQTSLLKINTNKYPWTDPIYGFVTAYFPHRTTVGSTPATDGTPGMPRGIHPDNVWKVIPAPGWVHRTNVRSRSEAAVDGNHIVIPISVRGDDIIGYQMAYTESLDGGQTFLVIPVSSLDDPTHPNIGGPGNNDIAIDSLGGVHYIVNYSLGVLNYSYTPPGGTPNNLVFPYGTEEPANNISKKAFVFIDDTDRVHIFSIGNGPGGDSYPASLYEITSDDYVNFTAPVECMVFPDEFWSFTVTDSHLSNTVMAMSGDGEIYISFKGSPEVWITTDIFYSHGFPGAMSQSIKINEDIPQSEYANNPLIQLIGKDVYIGWENQINDSKGISFDYPVTQIAYIPSGSLTPIITDLFYPSANRLHRFCANSWTAAIVEMSAGYSQANDYDDLLGYHKRFTFFSTDTGTYGNFLLDMHILPDNYSQSCISDSGIVMFSEGNLGIEDIAKYRFSPFDFY